MSEIKNLEIVEGDLLTSGVDLIAHQCNCVTNKAIGIAHAINSKYPYADIYSIRKVPDIPGTVVIRKGKEGEPIIACLLAQYYPGKPTGWDIYEVIL
jgi:O-acetyl-ADP-ribose deacetylase (regulator of RNase III)